MKNFVDLNKYFKEQNSFYMYNGSETSPPCRKINWFISNKNLEISRNQLFYFPILFGRNVNIRGLQKIKNRNIIKIDI